MDAKRTGALIAGCRREMNITQEQLAERLGVTGKAVSRWETGRGMPDISLLEPLAGALGVSVSELLAGERIAREELPERSDGLLLDALRYSVSVFLRLRAAAVIAAGAVLMLLPCVTAGIPGAGFTIAGVIMIAAGICGIIFRDRLERLKRRIAGRSINIMRKFAGWKAYVGAGALFAALLLEILPVGAVLIFAPAPGERVTESFSFFSLTPFGYANFFPLFAGVSTAAAALIAAVGLLRRRVRNTPAFVFSVMAAVFAALPAVVFGTGYMNIASWAIFALLIVSCALQAAANARQSIK